MSARQLEKQMTDFLTDVIGLSKTLVTEFEFNVGKTALSSWNYPFYTVMGYCIVIPILQKLMEKREPPSLKWILVLHNALLSIVSGFVAVLLWAKVIGYCQGGEHDLYDIFCGFNAEQQKGMFTLIFYWNYLLKYYELLDTVFLALKKKPIGFLHAYHHPATLVLAWAQLTEFTGVQWLVIGLNLGVHTVMYFYYALAALNIQMPFKQIVTISQILQFILDLIGCYICYFDGILGRDRCVVGMRAGTYGCFIISTYLFLFIDFYNETYSESKARKKIIAPTEEK